MEYGYGSAGLAATAVGIGAGVAPKAPDRKFRSGGITATVWKGISEKGTSYFNIQLSKSYKDKDNNWKTTGSFKDYEVPKAMVLLQKAYEYVILNQSEGYDKV